MNNDILRKVKQVPLPMILADFGINPARGSRVGGNRSLVYLASYRNEHHPSLSVFCYEGMWLFKDHATDEKGTSLDLLVRFGFFRDWKEAAEYISRKYLAGDSLFEQSRSITTPTKPVGTERIYQGLILRVVPIVGTPVERYISDTRCIPTHVAAKFLSFVHYSYPPVGKVYTGIGWQTVKGGWSIRWAAELGPGKGKAFIGPAGITLLGATHPSPEKKECAVFEGMFDFLSFLLLRKGGVDVDIDAVVLNSVSFVQEALALFTAYDLVHCFLDNDSAGRKATEDIQQAMPGKVTDHSYIYRESKDLNEFLKIINNS